MANDCGCGCDDSQEATKNTVPHAMGRSKLVRKYKRDTSQIINATKKIVQSLNQIKNG